MADAKLDAARRELAAQIAADIDALGANWVRPWVSQAPRNPLSGTVYKGRNALLLTHVIRKHRFSDPRFMTFTQARKAGLMVRRGAHGFPVERWQEVFFLKADPKEPVAQPKGARERAAMRRDPRYGTRVVPVGHYTVFNAGDIEGVEPFLVEATPENPEVMDLLVDHGPCPVDTVVSNGAFYEPRRDRITVPPAATFSSEGAFFRTLLHEECHATGAEGRLGRPAVCGRAGASHEDIAREELVAELGSVFAASRLSIDLSELTAADLAEGGRWAEHGAYLKGWLAAFDEGDRADALMTAATAAGRASDWLFDHCFSEAGNGGAEAGAA